MTPLSIFLIIVIIFSLISVSKKPQQETFISNCRTLRCINNKYSLSSMKNKATAKFKNASSGHLSTINNHLSNFKEKWL